MQHSLQILGELFAKYWQIIYICIVVIKTYHKGRLKNQKIK